MEKELLDLGIEEKVIDEIIKIKNKELKGYVKKDRYDDIANQTQELNKQLKERDAQLETLKNNSGDNEELKKRIVELQNTNIETENKFNKKLQDYRLNSEIENIGIKNGVKNTKVLKSLLDLTKVVITDEQVVGLDEQIQKLKETEDYLFNSETKSNPVIQSKKVVKEEITSFNKFLDNKRKEQDNIKSLEQIKVII